MNAFPRRAPARAAAALAFGILAGAPGKALAQAGASSTPPAPTPTPRSVNESVVVSANRANTPETEIPGEVTVVTGEELKQCNVNNLADAIQDVVGVDTGMGSDNGPRQPNVGLWGLKEFDALLFMVDGVPIGGPFNPSLSQINIDDIDRIEIVKGPQGTLYGVAAFAGMVQVFTKSGTAGTTIRLSGGSGTYSRMSCSRQTTSCTRESISGAAIARGTGVTRFTQCDERRGVSTGTGSTRRAGSSATAA